MNMSYCQFENTLGDFRQCVEDLEEPISEREAKMRDKLISAARKMIEDIDSGEITLGKISDDC